ncbi:protein brown-like, partial [Diaphorina citri]|uniref:Protein brown-like n=1 Tax=Diaphorina citri TaxID=121845 RepID=A0A3Q0JES5_DIACI
DFSGSLLLNGHQIDKNLMSRISGFVPQNDMAFEGLTVREHLEFMARLKMDKRTSYQSRRCIVATLVQDLGLAKCYNTQLSRLSGGEKKRVSLAVQVTSHLCFVQILGSPQNEEFKMKHIFRRNIRKQFRRKSRKTRPQNEVEFSTKISKLIIETL